MVEASAEDLSPILQRWSSLDEVIGSEFWVVRDDLLPFPLSGNKVRKIEAELRVLAPRGGVLISNGGIDSNHCRTLAMFAAQRGFHAHLVLHGKEDQTNRKAVQMLDALGATFDIGSSITIRDRIETAKNLFSAKGEEVHIISGGGHTPAGAKAFKEAGIQVFQKEILFDQVFVASGTGATQGGLIAAAETSGSDAEVLGISVARKANRGTLPVAEAARWAGSDSPNVQFIDDYIAGGYGEFDQRVAEAVKIGWRHGLPLDTTYTGKAFSAILDWSHRGLLGSSVLFWHTGGLWNWLASDNEEISINQCVVLQ